MNFVTLLAIPGRPLMLLAMLVVAHWVSTVVYRRLPPGRVRDFLFRPRTIIKRPEDYV